MILVTCAYGKVGRVIVPYLASKGVEIRAMDLNPDVVKLKEQGVKETIVADGTQQQEVEDAMKDINAVVYIPPQFTYQEAKMGFIAIEAAIKMGVKQFIDISLMYPNYDSNIHHTMKAQVEHKLLYRGYESHIMWTVLQPATYHHVINVKDAYDRGEYLDYCPVDMTNSWQDGRDEADVILQVLADPKGFNHGIFMLASETTTPNGIAKIISKVTGKPIKATFVNKDDVAKYWGPYFLGNDSYAKEAFYHLIDSNIKWGWEGNTKILNMLLAPQKPRTIEDYVREEATKYGLIK